MADEVQDLDILQPEPIKIKLSGQIIDLFPGKLKALIKIQKAFNAFQTAKADQDSFDNIVNALAVLIPRLKDDDIDISIANIPVLIELAYKVSVPNEAKELIDTEKKTDSSPQSPISSENTQPIN